MNPPAAFPGPQSFSPPRYESSLRSQPAGAYSDALIPTLDNSFDTSRHPIRTREKRHVSPPFVSPPRLEFNSRLYPGSVRHAARASALSRPSPPTEAALDQSTASKSAFGSSEDASKSYSRHHHTFSFKSNGSISSTTPLSSYVPAEDSPTSEMVEWKEFLPSTTRSNYSSGSGSQPKQSEGFSKAGLADHASHPFAHERTQFDTLQVQNLPTSPSLATASSPASSALGHSPGSVRHDVVVRNFYFFSDC